MKKQLMILYAALFLAAGCNYLEPLENGAYTEDNYQDYPELIRGFVEHAYYQRPSTYLSGRYIVADCIAGDATWRNPSEAARQFATGSATMTNNPFAGIWTADYDGIYYCNRFLKDFVGLGTKYIVHEVSNRNLQRTLHGDAYALRAWFYFDLLRFFGGRSPSGEMLGVPLLTEPVEAADADMASVRRAGYDDCIRQILSDCDSALAYLPLANRDFLVEEQEPVVTLGAVRYRRFDGVSVKALKSLVMLTWASPAFNPGNDISRWEEAARLAKEVIDHKLTLESAEAVVGGFDPAKPFMWNNPNATGAIYVSNIAENASFETNFYPSGFSGTATYVPTDDFVQCFPMANGYPITDIRSQYDPKDPYKGRDPRLYANIYYHGSEAVRNTNPDDIMYTFNMAEGTGQDAPGLLNTSPTGYYIKKYVYMGWNGKDPTPQVAQHCIFFYRWAHMCLVFAEAANQVVGPLDRSRFGLSAKEALAYLRNRPLEDGSQGLGVDGDPYLEECARFGQRHFDALVRNEWRIETFLEGFRFHNIRRWNEDSVLNDDIHAVRVTMDGATPVYEVTTLEKRRFPSPWFPLPYMEVRRCPGLEQNSGWENWK